MLAGCQRIVRKAGRAWPNLTDSVAHLAARNHHAVPLVEFRGGDTVGSGPRWRELWPAVRANGGRGGRDREPAAYCIAAARLARGRTDQGLCASWGWTRSLLTVRNAS